MVYVFAINSKLKIDKQKERVKAKQRVKKHRERERRGEMSTIYVSEPPTKGKVVINTTYGPLDIELWPKEAPKAVRNFVQLCLEGYFDNLIFHRIIKSFLVQSGDPTGTGTVAVPGKFRLRACLASGFLEDRYIDIHTYIRVIEREREMSSIYVSEPPTKSKVLINTAYAPLDIELWPKEAPKAVRNFLHLCLEGYYDNSIFHRIIKYFLVRSGNSTGTGRGGESIYGNAFADEFHSRLRFNHRGIVACANAGGSHSNGSQFFITLDRCDWLDRKHTIFGKVTGDSLYNLLPLGEIETDKDDRPLDPQPKISSVEVLWNPFDDIIPRQVPPRTSPSTVITDNKASEKKAVKKLNLLSFGEEAEEEEKELATVKTKIKSSHDVLNDPRLLKEQTSTDKAIDEKTRDVQLSVREALSIKRGVFPKNSEDYSDDDEASFDVKMRLQILNTRKGLGDNPAEKKSRNGGSRPKPRERSPPSSRSKPESSDDEQKVAKLYMKKKGMGSEARAEHIVKTDTDLLLFNEAERQRQIKKQKKRRGQGHEEETLAKLGRFMKTISSKTAETMSKSGDEDLSGWTGGTLKFAPESGKGNMSRREDVNDYVVDDPLSEKGKEKFNKMQAKQKRKDREWAGKSLT